MTKLIYNCTTFYLLHDLAEKYIKYIQQDQNYQQMRSKETWFQFYISIQYKGFLTGFMIRFMISWCDSWHYPQKRAEIVKIHCQFIWYLEQNEACTTISLQLKNDIARDSRAISFLPCSEIAKSWKITNFFHWFLMFLLGIKSKLHLGSLHRQIFCRDEAMKAFLTKALRKTLTKALRKTKTLTNKLTNT